MILSEQDKVATLISTDSVMDGSLEAERVLSVVLSWLSFQLLHSIAWAVLQSICSIIESSLSVSTWAQQRSHEN